MIKKFRNSYNFVKQEVHCIGPPTFKSKRVGHQSNQKLLQHYHHAKNHAKIQYILGSHKLKDHGQF